MTKVKKSKPTKTAEMDLTGVAEEEGLTKALWEAIGMPERREENWNALRTTILAGGRLPKRLAAKGWTAFQKEQPQAVKRFWKLLDDYADRDDHPKCKFVNLEGASDMMLWAPDLLLLGSLPVEVLSLIVIFFRDSWKIAAVGLLLSIALAVQVVILACTVFMMQSRWHVTRRRKRLALWRAGLSVLLCAAALVGLLYQGGKAGITLAAGIAMAGSVVALVTNLFYTSIFLWKTR